MANFKKWVGSVEVSFPESTSQGRDLTDEEAPHFETAWRQIQRRFHTIGRTDLFGDDVKEALRTVLGIELKKRGTSFEGMTPQEGLGMQPIHPADLFGNDGTDGWTEATNGIWDINWANAGWRTWWGAPAAGDTLIAHGGAAAGDAFGAHRRTVQADRQNNAIIWANVIWAVQDFNPSPKPLRLRIEQGKEVDGDIELQDQLRGTELRFADLGRMYYFSHPQPFASAVEIRAGINNAGLGVSSLRPVGVTIAPSLRLRNTAATVRDAAAITA